MLFRSLNSSDSKFDQHLSDICQQYQPHLAFDAVAGSLTMKVLEAMPSHSKVIVYGGLSYKPVQANPGQLIFQDKSIIGFLLSTWLRRKNIIQSLKIWQRAQKLLTTDLKSKIRGHYPLSEVQKAIKEYQKQMTDGKCLLRSEH